MILTLNNLYKLKQLRPDLSMHDRITLRENMIFLARWGFHYEILNGVIFTVKPITVFKDSHPPLPINIIPTGYS